MFDKLMVDHLIVREALNGAAFPLSLFLTMSVCFYLWQTFVLYGPGWTRQPGVSTACALAWLFFAETCRAGSVWFILQANNDGRVIPQNTIFTLNCILAASTIVLVLAFLRCTFLFTPDHLGNMTWIMSFIVALLFVIISLAT